MKRARTVDEYIALSPEEHQKKLRELRAIIKSAAQKAEEKISYGIPYYGYRGRLAYFRSARGYIGMYIPPPVIDERKAEAKGYAKTKSTLHFPLDRKLPAALIRKLIKARMKKNESKG